MVSRLNEKQLKPDLNSLLGEKINKEITDKFKSKETDKLVNK
jgi:hypothetical protein